MATPAPLMSGTLPPQPPSPSPASLSASAPVSSEKLSGTGSTTGSTGATWNKQKQTKPTLTLRFFVKRRPEPGQQMFVCGNIPALGSDEPVKALRLTVGRDEIWSGSVALPPAAVGTPITFKLLVTGADAAKDRLWEEGGPHTIPATQLHGAVLYVAAVWREPNLDHYSRPVNPRKKAKVPKEKMSHAPKPLTQAELAVLRTTITQKAEELRLLREADPHKDAPVSTKPAIIAAAADLLELKHQDPDWVAVCNPKLFKLRWEICGVRLQARVDDCVSLQADELARIVTVTTHRRFPDLGALKSVRVMENGQWRVMEGTAKLRLPLEFPGPLFKDSHVFTLAATFERDISDAPLREKYWPAV